MLNVTENEETMYSTVSGVMRGTLTAHGISPTWQINLMAGQDEYISRLEQALAIAYHNLNYLMALRTYRVPEFFDLKPLASNPISFSIQRTGSPPFHFINDD